MKKYQSFLLLISISINVIVGTFALKNINVSLAQPQTSAITTAGIYGPAGKETINGDVTITASDVVLRNTLITGNLYLTEDIAEGEVRLVNVTVKGETVISGGGKNTIILEDTALQKLLVNKEDIEKEPANLTLLNSTTVAAIQIEAAATITGQGTITHLQIGSAGQVAVAGSIETLTVTGTDNRLELTGGTIRKLTVSQTETSTAVRLREKTLVENMELYGKAQVTGAGLIGTVTINASNTVLETESAPEQITLATGITAIVNGKEYPEKIAVTTPPKATPPKKTNPTHTPKPVPPTHPSPSPDSVKEFIVQEGISVGKKMVVVKLYAADPSTYTVTVGGERLNYMASQQSFYGEVDEGSANRSSVRVSQQ